MTVHAIAKAGFGQGTNDHYDRARPSYPPNALSALYSAIRTKAPFNIVELGSGTGIFTRALLAHEAFSSSVERITAIEPSDGMREVFNKQTQDPRASTKSGTFEDTGIIDASADLVVVAQAWHWCPNYDAAMKEIARILKPEGVAFFIWNLEDRDAAEWVRRVRDVYEKYEQNTPQFRLGLWRATFDTDGYKQNFEPQVEQSWDRAIPTTTQGVVDRVLSKSYITQLSDNEKKELRKSIQNYVAEDGSKVWIDEAQGTFEYPYKTFLVVMNKKAN